MLKEKVRLDILNGMMDSLGKEQLQKLSHVLDISLHDYDLINNKNEITLYDDSNDRIVNTFIATMRLEGKSENTIYMYQLQINLMIEEIQKPIKYITTDDIRYYLSVCQEKRKISKCTIDNKRRCLSAFFSWLVANDYISKNPMSLIKKVKQDKKIKQSFSDKELEEIRDTIDSCRDRAIIEFMISTGCRVTEISNLNMKDIDFITGECIVFGKGNKERKVYISEKCMYHLVKYLNSRTDTCEALFVNKFNNRLSKQSIEKALRKIQNNSSISKIHPHKFRRTFCTKAISRGMSVQNVQRIMGHNSLDTTMLYYSIDEKKILSEYKKCID